MAPTSTNGLIFVVDDDAAVAASRAFLLRNEGFAVVECNGVAHALDAIYRGAQPKAILSSLAMRGMDGITFAKTLRHRTKCQSTRILLLTDTRCDIDMSDLFEFDGVYVEPFDMAEITSALRTLLPRAA